MNAILILSVIAVVTAGYFIVKARRSKASKHIGDTGTSYGNKDNAVKKDSINS